MISRYFLFIATAPAVFALFCKGKKNRQKKSFSFHTTFLFQKEVPRQKPRDFLFDYYWCFYDLLIFLLSFFPKAELQLYVKL